MKYIFFYLIPSFIHEVLKLNVMLYMFYYVHSISVVKIEDCKIYVMFACIVSVTSSILYTLKVDLSHSKCQSNVISASVVIYRNY